MNRIRSKRYPAISSSDAIRFSARAFGKFGNERVERDSLAAGLGFTSGSGGQGAQVLSSLVQYGFLNQVRGTGQYAATLLAERASRAETAEDRRRLSRQVIFNPPLFKTLIEKFVSRKGDSIPSRLKELLMANHGIAKTASETAAIAFVDSLHHAGILAADRESILNVPSKLKNEPRSSETEIPHSRPQPMVPAGQSPFIGEDHQVPPSSMPGGYSGTARTTIDRTEFEVLKYRIKKDWATHFAGFIGVIVSSLTGLWGIASKPDWHQDETAVSLAIALSAIALVFFLLTALNWMNSKENGSDPVTHAVLSRIGRRLELDPITDILASRNIAASNSTRPISPPVEVEVRNFPRASMPTIIVLPPYLPEDLAPSYETLCLETSLEIGRLLEEQLGEQVKILSFERRSKESLRQRVGASTYHFNGKVSYFGSAENKLRYQAKLTRSHDRALVVSDPLFIDPSDDRSTDYTELVEKIVTRLRSDHPGSFRD